MRIVCQQTIFMNIMPYLLFLKKKKQQNLKLSSAANYRWRFTFLKLHYLVFLASAFKSVPIIVLGSYEELMAIDGRF